MQAGAVAQIARRAAAAHPGDGAWLPGPPLHLDSAPSRPPGVGSGGRPWVVKFTVYESGNSSPDDALSNVLNNGTNSNPYIYPVRIDLQEYPNAEHPNAEWKVNVAYTIVVELCNFMDLCSTGQAPTLITDQRVPSLSIGGSHIRYITRNQGLSLTSFAEVKNCSGAASKANIAYLYELGLGVEQNYSEALKWYELSTKNENPYASETLGRWYLEGKHIKKNIEKGFKYLETATNLGNNNAANSLGWYYQEGLHVETVQIVENCTHMDTHTKSSHQP